MLVVLVILCASISLSNACSCMPSFGPSRFCRYNLIVHGTAMAEYLQREEPYDPRDPLSVFSPYDKYVYTINVTEAIRVPDSLKGSEKVSIISSNQESLCGTRLALDIEGVFFARMNSEGKAETGLCAPNVAWVRLSEMDRSFLSPERFEQYCADESEIKPPSPPSPPGFNP